MNLRNSSVARMLRAAAVLLLVVGTFSSGLPTAAPLDARDLARSTGTGIWNDPCTWDGFAVGAGLVLIGSGSPSGFGSVFTGLMKAIYVDNCF